MSAAKTGRAAACALAVAGCAGQFNYTFCGLPGTSASTSVALGASAAACINLNGAVTTLFTPTVDTFSAFQIDGSNYAFPTGAGYILQGYGWVPNINSTQFNCSTGTDPQTFYATVDVSYLGVSTSSPRIYKQFVYDFCTSTLSSVVTFPLLTAIITMSNGQPSYIAWDDGCFFCASNGASCAYNALDTGAYTAAANSNFMSCYTDSSSCYTAASVASASPTPSATPSAASASGTRSASASVSASATDTPLVNTSATSTPTRSTTPSALATPSVSASFVNTSGASIPQSACDLKVFLVWSGSDSHGQYFTSSNKRFSRFRQFGTATVYQSAINLGTSGLSVAQNALGLTNGVPGRLIPGGNTRRLLREKGAGAVISSAVPEQPTVAATSGERARVDDAGELFPGVTGCRGSYAVRILPADGGVTVHEVPV